MLIGAVQAFLWEGSRREPRRSDLAGTAWQTGGGSVWGWISYDPELDLVFYGTANPGTWNPDLRPGDNKWSSTIFARKPETGEAIWAYQINPHDLHDYDGVNENLLLDIPWRARVGDSCTRPQRLRVRSRSLTGEVLYAKPYVHITSSDSVNVATGELALNDAKEPKMEQGGPGHLSRGAREERLAALRILPAHGAVYMPHQNFAMDKESTSARATSPARPTSE